MAKYIHEKIQKPKEETAFCYTKRRPFLASILRRQKIRIKAKVGEKSRTCPTCGHVAVKSIYKTHMVWGNWVTIKKKACRSKNRAITIAEKWYNQYINRKPRKVKVVLT
jgi:putative component of membrane protein insertase Oxa1/YidC/SpoIIIJ protein YidD